MFHGLTYLVAAVLFAFGFYAYIRYRDPFHPAIYLAGLLFFIYVFTPLYLDAQSPSKLRYYLRDDALIRTQTLALFTIISLMVGVLIGSRRCRRERTGRISIVPSLDDRRLYALGVALGVIATSAWLYAIIGAGGIETAYGRAYGGAGDKSGYINEAQYLSIPAVLLIFLARRHGVMRPSDWAIVLLFVAPIFLHGLLGARRGPTFLVVVAVAAGWYVTRARRPALPVVLSAGVVLGFFLMFLLANRTEIYIGSSLELEGSAFDRLTVSGTNEFVYGGAVIQYADHYEAYFWGRRLLTTFLARPIPRQLWPDQYADMAEWLGFKGDMTLNYGVDIIGMYMLFGWWPGIGSATGVVADIWLEFGPLMPLATFAIGWFYGRIWRLSLRRGTWSLFYVLMMSLSIYLVMQDTQAWGYRLAFSGAALALCGLMARKRKQRAPAPGAGQAHVVRHEAG